MKKVRSKKWLACLLSVVMAILMLPAAALAQEDSGVTVYINGSLGRDTNEGLTSSAPVQTMGKALELAGEGGTIVILGTVYIREDVTIENVTVERGENLTNAMFYVYEPSEVTVKNAVIDGSSEKTLSSGGYIFNLFINTVLNIEEGADIGNNDVLAVNMTSATLNMSGGSLHDNSDDTGNVNYGAAIRAYNSELNFTGGIVENNYSTDSGAGVFAYGSSSILVDGAVFRNNRAVFNGGAIYIEAAEGGSSLTMNSGKIINNYAGGSSGGIYAFLWKDSMDVEITGGTISGNLEYVEGDFDTGEFNTERASSIGIGLGYGYDLDPLEYPSLKLSGSPEIKDGIFMFDEGTEGPVIEVTGELNISAPIIVSDDWRSEGRTVIKYADGLTPKQTDFIAEDEQYGFIADGQELKWIQLLRVPFKTTDNLTTYEVIYVYLNSLIDFEQAPVPTKTGYTLEGWKRYGQDVLWDFENNVVTERMSLLASWVLNAPEVIVEADKTNVHVGESVTITATASHDLDEASFSYEWYKDGVLIEGESGNTLTVTESGEYSVKVTAAIADSGDSAYFQSEGIACTVGHSFAEEWTSDENSHWHACAGCDEKSDEAEHTFEWVIDKEATDTQTGSKHEECSVCGYKGAAVDIPANTSDSGLLWILVLAGVCGLAGAGLAIKKRKA